MNRAKDLKFYTRTWKNQSLKGNYGGDKGNQGNQNFDPLTGVNEICHVTKYSSACGNHFDSLSKKPEIVLIHFQNDESFCSIAKSHFDPLFAFLNLRSGSLKLDQYNINLFFNWIRPVVPT